MKIWLFISIVCVICIYLDKLLFLHKLKFYVLFLYFFQSWKGKNAMFVVAQPEKERLPTVSIFWIYSDIIFILTVEIFERPVLSVIYNK